MNRHFNVPCSKKTMMNRQTKGGLVIEQNIIWWQEERLLHSKGNNKK
jgi:hypothetical protein